MISLGCWDPNLSPSTCDAYLERVEAITRVPMAKIAEGSDKLTFKQYQPDDRQPMSVKQVQQALTASGFFPGGQADGICGYRTLSAVRLFQEYVRTVEKLPCDPDGRFGPQSQKHLKRWMDNRDNKTRWTPAIERWQAGTLRQTEYTAWLSLLRKVKKKYADHPNRMLELVNAFTGSTNTQKVARWDFDPQRVHLIGIRRSEFRGKFDDVFVLLIKGLVFKFQGSTEPGSSSSVRGTPFLVQGQHDYHFGWHQKKYLALRPQNLGGNDGVLVVRSKNDKRLNDADLNNGLEANSSINIHWGGKGGKFDVRSWSAGCQVINGSLYSNDENELCDCTGFVATNNGELVRDRSKTRGAYNTLLDLVTALSGDTGSSTVKYMLLGEQDLDLDPKLSQGLAAVRARVRERIG